MRACACVWRLWARRTAGLGEMTIAVGTPAIGDEKPYPLNVVVFDTPPLPILSRSRLRCF